jgi:hypothetical protein
MLGIDKEPSLRAKCRIPDGWPAFRLAVHDPLAKAGYSVSFYGHLITPAAAMPDAPTVRMFGSPDILTVLALQRCVYHAETVLWLEALWSPQDGVRITMHGLERPHAKEAMDVIRYGLVILRQMEKTGRPRETTRYYTKEAFHAAYPDAYRKATRRRTRPRDEDIARALHLSLATFRRYIREYGRPSLCEALPISPHSDFLIVFDT